jgi:hypothetical protein
VGLPRRSFGVVCIVVGAAPLGLAVSGVDECRVLLDGVSACLDRFEAALAAVEQAIAARTLTEGAIHVESLEARTSP